MKLTLIHGVLLYIVVDELIRQVSIINVDRGELLIRIRNEFKSTIQVYSQIFKDSLLFSNKKIAIVSTYLYINIGSSKSFSIVPFPCSP